MQRVVNGGVVDGGVVDGGVDGGVALCIYFCGIILVALILMLLSTMQKDGKQMQNVSTHYKVLDVKELYHIKHTTTTVFDLFTYTQTTQHVIEFSIRGELVYSILVHANTYDIQHINTTPLYGSVLYASVHDYKEFVLQSYARRLVLEYYQ